MTKTKFETLKFPTYEEIKEDEDMLNQYGWKMRLMQVEDDIWKLQIEREEILSHIRK